MNNSHRFIYTVQILLLLLSGCGNTPEVVTPEITPPDQTMSGIRLNGIVTDTHSSISNNLIHIAVVDESNQIGIPGVVSILPETPTFIQEQGVFAPFKIENIVIGQKITVIASEVLEGVPLSIKATEVLLRDNGPKDSMTPLLTWIKPDFEGVIKEITTVNNASTPVLNLTIDPVSIQDHGKNQLLFISITEKTIIWTKDKDGYSLKKLGYIVPGQSVNILLFQDHDSLFPSTYNPVLEIIVNSE